MLQHRGDLNVRGALTQEMFTPAGGDKNYYRTSFEVALAAAGIRLARPKASPNRHSAPRTGPHGSWVPDRASLRVAGRMGLVTWGTEVCPDLRVGNIDNREPPSWGSAQTNQTAPPGLPDRGSCDRARYCSGDFDHGGSTADGAPTWLLGRPAHFR